MRDALIRHGRSAIKLFVGVGEDDKKSGE